MIPQPDFYLDFSALFRSNPFGELQHVWNPLLTLLDKKGKLVSVAAHLAEIHSDKNSTENAQEMSGLWIDNILQRIEAKDKDFSQSLSRALLQVVMKAPNSHTKIFLPRFVQSSIAQ
jgi:hypothetical protein